MLCYCMWKTKQNVVFIEKTSQFLVVFQFEKFECLAQIKKMNKIYTKFTPFKSFRNETKAQKWMEKVKSGWSNQTLFIRKRTSNKDDGKKFQVGYISRKGRKKSQITTVT